MRSPICGPPPCTTTGATPICRSSTMSAAKPSVSAGSTMALPPNLTTTTLPRQRLMYGSISTSSSARST